MVILGVLLGLCVIISPIIIRIRLKHREKTQKEMNETLKDPLPTFNENELISIERRYVNINSNPLKNSDFMHNSLTQTINTKTVDASQCEISTVKLTQIDGDLSIMEYDGNHRIRK